MRFFSGMTWSVIGILLSFGCSSDRITGTKGGSETTNGIVATVFTGDGHPAVGSVVRVRRLDYVNYPDSVQDSSNDNADIATDDSGRFLVQGLDTGYYHVEINDTVTTNYQGGAVLCTCFVGETDTFDLGTRSLQPYARMNGTIIRSDSGDDDLVVHVKGLERSVPVAEDGSFTIHDLPAGRMEILVVNQTKKLQQEVDDVITTPGDTVKVQVTDEMAWSRYLYLDSLVADLPDSTIFESFPLLVRLNAQTFDFSQAQPEGEDIRFTRRDGTPFVYGIEQWDSEAQTAAIWVEIDSVFGGRTNQVVVMQWGDPEAESMSADSAIFTTEDGYMGVWHLSQRPETAPATIETVPGMIGSGLRFNGVDDSIQFDSLNVSGDYTLSCWITIAASEHNQKIIWKDSSYSLWYDESIGGLRVEHFTDSLIWRGGENAVVIATDTWYHFVSTYNGDRIIFYLNGEVIDSTDIIENDPRDTATPLLLGGHDGAFFKGILDEVRIENVKHSAGWISLSYLNQREHCIGHLHGDTCTTSE